jgi:hypothetical protein
VINLVKGLAKIQESSLHWYSHVIVGMKITGFSLMFPSAVFRAGMTLLSDLISLRYE